MFGFAFESIFKMFISRIWNYTVQMMKEEEEVEQAVGFLR
jgi:hypothetical protein